MDRFVALDTETTGLKPRHNDIIEIAVVLLDHNFNMDHLKTPFHTYMLPSRPENVDIKALKVQETSFNEQDNDALTRKKFNEVMKFGIDNVKAGDLFIEWFESLCLPPKGRLIPIGHNVGFDIEFIVDWLGPHTYEYIFSHNYRCTRQLAGFINDLCVYKNRPPLFGLDTRLANVCNVLGCKLINAHNALDDALASADCYRKMLTLNG